MDTLISLGVLAAYGWSLYALLFGDAGVTGMKMGAGGDEIYLETASVVTTFILAGRYFEARAKRRAGAALKALLELGAKDVNLLDGRTIPIEQLKVGDDFVVRPGEKVATDGIVVEGNSAVDMSLLTGESDPRRGRPRRRRGGRDGQRRRPPGRPRREGRQRHRARADRQARHRRPVRQGRRAAARRSRRRRVRPGRDRAGRGHARVLARHGRERDVRVHRRRRRADHRLPVRARARHAGRAAGRHRPRRAARAADQGPRGPRVHPQGRHDRARQDGHGHDRPDDADRRAHQRDRTRARRCG